MLHFHLTQNSCSVICDGDLSIGRDENFIKTCDGWMTQDGLNKQEELTPRSKRRADNVGHSFCG